MNYIAEFLTELFKKLNDSSLTYCVLKNYEKLPEMVGHDVDIWVHEKDEKVFQKKLLQTAQDVGWKIVRYAPWWTHYGQGRYFFVKDDGNFHVLHIDCLVPIHWKGISYVDEEVIPRSLSFYKGGFYIPSPGIEGSAKLFPRLLSDGKIREKDKGRIQECLKDRESFLEATIKPIGKEASEMILRMVEEEDWESLENLQRYLSKLLIKRALLKRPLIQLNRWRRYLWSRFKEHLFENLGIFMVLIGPDGSGKTSIANAILKSEKMKNLFQIKSYFHGRFSYIPQLKTFMAVFNRIGKNQQFIGNPIPVFSPGEFGILRAMLYPLYYSLDYLIGHFFIRKVRAYYCIAVSDRYFYDYWFQKKYKQCPRWFLLFLSKIIPKPDILIYLKSSPRTIYGRKQDLPLEEIKRQVRICEELARKIPNGFIIDASSEIEEVSKQVQKIIFDIIETKWKNSRGYKYLSDLV